MSVESIRRRDARDDLDIVEGRVHRVHVSARMTGCYISSSDIWTVRGVELRLKVIVLQNFRTCSVRRTKVKVVDIRRELLNEMNYVRNCVACGVRMSQGTANVVDWYKRRNCVACEGVDDTLRFCSACGVESTVLKGFRCQSCQALFNGLDDMIDDSIDKHIRLHRLSRSAVVELDVRPDIFKRLIGDR